MIRFVFIALIIILNLFFSGGLFVQINIIGIQSDLLMTAMVCMLMYERTFTPIGMAMIGGLIIDVVLSPAMGFYTIPYIIIGLVIYYLYPMLQQKGWWIGLVAVAGATLAKDIIHEVIALFLGHAQNIGSMLLRYTLPSAVLNCLIALLLLWLFKKLYHKGWLSPVFQKHSEL